jgi:hypothetical protein
MPSATSGTHELAVGYSQTKIRRLWVKDFVGACGITKKYQIPRHAA